MCVCVVSVIQEQQESVGAEHKTVKSRSKGGRRLSAQHSIKKRRKREKEKEIMKLKEWERIDVGDNRG